MTPPRKSSQRPAKKDRAAAMRHEREAAERRGQRWNYAIAALAVVAVAGLVALALTREDDGAADVEITGLLSFPNLDQEHTEAPVEYEQTPPAGGPHNPAWLNCGIYSDPVPTENAVHSLEHGVVWITYDPELAEADVETLRDFVGDLRSSTRQKVLLSPFDGLPAPLVASAWGQQVHLDGVDDERLGLFVDQFVNGAQSPEPTAPCTQGVGTPDA